MKKTFALAISLVAAPTLFAEEASALNGKTLRCSINAAYIKSLQQ